MIKVWNMAHIDLLPDIRFKVQVQPWALYFETRAVSDRTPHVRCTDIFIDKMRR